MDLKTNVFDLLVYALVVIGVISIYNYFVVPKTEVAKPTVQVVKTVATTPSTKVTVTSKPIEFVKVNKRGDQKVKPVDVLVTTTKPIQSGEEIPITITPETTYKAKLNKWKLTPYAVYRDKLEFGFGGLYEVYNVSDFNFNIGVGNTGVLGCVGYTITPTVECYIGASIAKEVTAIVGIGVRL